MLRVSVSLSPKLGLFLLYLESQRLCLGDKTRRLTRQEHKQVGVFLHGGSAQ